MNASASLDEILTAVSKILLWCFFLGMVVLLLWFVLFLAAGDLAHRVHVKMFDVTEHEFDLINYCGMALVKVWSFLFFLIPWIGTRLALMGVRKSGATQTP